jgi:hypothetical protein
LLILPLFPFTFPVAVDTIKVRREDYDMKKIYITVTGTKYYFGKEFFKEDRPVRLVKEPDNEVDKEAIKVELEGLGTIGYVANSPYTVAGESYSAGRLYDRMGDEAEAKMLYDISQGIMCVLEQPIAMAEEEGECTEQ